MYMFIYPFSFNISKLKTSNTSFTILISSILINIMIFFSSSNKWIPLLLSMFYSGGILILLSYMISSSPNQETKLSSSMLISITLIILFIPLMSKFSSNLKEKIHKISFLNETKMILFIITLLIIFANIMKPSKFNTFQSMKSSI